MKKILVIASISMFILACKKEVKQTNDSQNNTTVESNITNDSIRGGSTNSESLEKEPTTKETQENSSNSANKKLEQKIVGVWEVKNDYYEATYEIEALKGKYVGKVHYYKDDSTEYKGKNTEDDYFLNNVIYKNGKYINGKMFLPDGSNYNVTFKLKNDNALEAKMTIEGQPYSEIWNRKRN